MSRRLRVLAAIGLALGLLLLEAATAYARGGGRFGGGGGGGGFRGGGGGGGGFSGGGYGGGLGGYGGFGGFGGGIPLPFFFLGGGSGNLIFLLIILFVLFRLYRMLNVGRPMTALTFGPAHAPLIGNAPLASQLAALQAEDPAFDQQAFLDKVRTLFLGLQKAWMDRDLEPVRASMSDGLYQRWKQQVDGMVTARRRDVLENLAVDGAEVVQVVAEGGADSITVRIDASAADYVVDVDTNQMLFGDRQPTRFTEYWTFVRTPAGMRSHDGAEFGWVLDSITQPADWQG